MPFSFAFQVALAKTLGIAQQTMAHYEGGSLRVAVALLPPLAEALGMPIEELVGKKSKPGKRGPTPKLQTQLERISQLPRADQKLVSEFLDAVIQKNEAKGWNKAG